MSIKVLDQDVILSYSDAFLYRYEKHSEENSRAYSIVKALILSAAYDVRIPKTEIISHLRSRSGDRLSKRISDWKISIPIPFPFNQTSFNLISCPYFDSSTEAVKLSNYLKTFCHDMSRGNYSIDQLLLKLLEINTLTSAFEEETLKMDECWYRFDPSLKPHQIVSGYAPSESQFSRDDFSLKQNRLESAQIIRGQIIQTMTRLIQNLNTFSSQIMSVKPKLTVDSASHQVSEGIARKWQSTALVNVTAACLKLMNDELNQIQKVISEFNLSRLAKALDSKEKDEKYLNSVIDRFIEVIEKIPKMEKLHKAITSCPDPEYQKCDKNSHDVLKATLTKWNQALSPNLVSRSEHRDFQPLYKYIESRCKHIARDGPAIKEVRKLCN